MACSNSRIVLWCLIFFFPHTKIIIFLSPSSWPPFSKHSGFAPVSHQYPTEEAAEVLERVRIKWGLPAVRNLRTSQRLSPPVIPDFPSDIPAAYWTLFIIMSHCVWDLSSTCEPISVPVSMGGSGQLEQAGNSYPEICAGEGKNSCEIIKQDWVDKFGSAEAQTFHGTLWAW